MAGALEVAHGGTGLGDEPHSLEFGGTNGSPKTGIHDRVFDWRVDLVTNGHMILQLTGRTPKPAELFGLE